jgi:hypothetical protein
MQSGAQSFCAAEAQTGRDWQSGESALDRKARAALQGGAQDFSASQSQLDRDLQRELSAMRVKPSVPTAANVEMPFGEDGAGKIKYALPMESLGGLGLPGVGGGANAGGDALAALKAMFPAASEEDLARLAAVRARSPGLF